MTFLRALAVAVVLAATAVTFQPVLEHGFLNWDDPRVVTHPRLADPLPARLAWAFSTTDMQHYQPLAWLAYGALAAAPDHAAAVHGASLALHLLNVALLFWVTTRLTSVGDDDEAWWIPAAATALFAVHPLRVEPVAWASALPYLLSYASLLPATGLWVAWLRNDRGTTLAWSVGLYLLSQLCRVTAPLYPLLLVVMAGAVPGARARPWLALLRAAAPFAVIALPLAWLEAEARALESLADIGFGPRIAWALTHPASYLGHTLWPGPGSPLDVLPRLPVASWGPALIGVIVAAVLGIGTALVSSTAVAAAVWGSYLLLLLPVLGLMPSGLQLTADRYMYGPAMVLSIGLAAALMRAPARLRQACLLGAGAAAVSFGMSAHARTADWHDSIALWSRAVALDADNDVALYNLAEAEVAAARLDAAMTHYARLLALVPDHTLARRRLDALQADREEQSGDAAATAGRFYEAISAYDRALTFDGSRTAVRLKRGMARATRGDLAAALPDLEAGAAAGGDRPAVTNALALALANAGRTSDALATLFAAQTRHPDDVGLTGNLARLLLTAEPASLRDASRALGLAARAAQATGMRDPRLLDTLGLAFAAVGQSEDARRTWSRGAALARDSGDADLAATLEGRLASLRH